MFEVRIKNFQSLSDATMRVDGFTALTGPNNSGKSALIRAVLGLFSNSPASFVRTGEKYAEVTITFEDGNTVTWQKGKGVNSYEVNGHRLDLVGRGAPKEVEALGVGVAKVGSHKLWPQIASQGVGQVFLLDCAGSTVAEAIADVQRVGILNQALSFAESDKRKLASVLKIREKDEAAVREDLARFQGLDHVCNRIGDLARIRGEAQALRAEHTVLCGVRQELQDARMLAVTLKGVEDIRCPPSQDFDKLRRVTVAVGELEVVSRDLEKSRDLLTSLEGSEQISAPENVLIEKAREILLSIEESEQTNREWKANKRLLGSLPEVSPVDTDVERLRKVAEFIDTLKRIRAEISEQQVLVQSLEHFDPESVQMSPLERLRACERGVELLQEYQEDMKQAQAQIREADQEIVQAQAVLKSVMIQISETLGSFEMCPLCGAETEKGHAHV